MPLITSVLRSTVFGAGRVQSGERVGDREDRAPDTQIAFSPPPLSSPYPPRVDPERPHCSALHDIFPKPHPEKAIAGYGSNAMPTQHARSPCESQKCVLG